MAHMKKSLLIEILQRGILEIRALSSGKNEENIERIHVLANILHNIPRVLIEKPEPFNYEFLFNELLKYEKIYGNSGVGLSDVIN